ncbi:hypothetical protein FBULB1_4301 [Fusarium bulbicola]|nr:hypothetical protein FBULB1_4301 [Fusarium bulbicola]
MPFDPLTVIGIIGLATGLLSFVASTVENIDKRIRDYQQCRSRLIHYRHEVELAQCYYRVWLRIWCDGDKLYPEETYEYFWGEGGYAAICERLDNVRDCSLSVQSLLRFTLAEQGLDSLLLKGSINKPKLVLSTGRTASGGERSVDWKKKVCFALYENTRLKNAVEQLKDSVQNLSSYSAAIFWELQDQTNLSKEPDSELIDQLSMLKTRVEEWSEFMEKVYLKQANGEGSWAMTLRLPDGEGSPKSLISDSDIKVDFVVERKVLKTQTFVEEGVVWYPEEPNTGRYCSPSTASLEVPGCYNQGPILEYRPVPFRHILERISQSCIQMDDGPLHATRLERCRGALGLANWAVLLWNTSWSSNICTCSIRSTFGADDNCRFTLHWKDNNHIFPQCVMTINQTWKYYLLGVALAELATGVPLKYDDVAKAVHGGPKTEQFTNFQRTVERKTCNEYRKAVEYCFKMAGNSTTNTFRPEQLQRHTSQVVEPIERYYEQLTSHDETQKGRKWKNLQMEASQSTSTSNMTKPQIIVKIPPPSDVEDKSLVSALTNIVNTAYKKAESDIFTPSYQRTSTAEITRFLNNGQLAVAYLQPKNEPIGCVFIKLTTPALGEFGMLALDPQYQGTDAGRQLAVFAEDECRRRGRTTMQLEILVPMTFHHEGKARLLGWYTRMGYELVKLGDFADDYPDLVNLLAGPTEYRVFEKSLV